jgi:hypothetical protein
VSLLRLIPDEVYQVGGLVWLTVISIFVLALCVDDTHNNRRTDAIADEVHEAGGTNPEGLPGRMALLEEALTDVISALQEFAATQRHDSEPVEFIGNFVGPDDYGQTDDSDTGPVQVVEPKTAPFVAPHPSPSRPKPTPGPRTTPTGEAIEQGKRDLTDSQPVVPHVTREIGGHTFNFKTTGD